ncbi:MAG: hypothetical protein C4325_05745 [Blastocatellia bacterium]
MKNPAQFHVIRRARFFALFAALFPAFLFAQRDMPISAVQGTTNISPVAGQIVRVSGIVTGRTQNGFFLQTPDSKADANPLTSEGIFVFTREEPMAEAAIGNEVLVTGRVEEFRPRADLFGLTVTEILFSRGRDTFSVISKNNPLPKPIVLTLEDFKPNTVDQLEKYEGMRVAVESLITVAPTGGHVDPRTETVKSDGVFAGVLRGIPRPFREPGMDVLMYLASDQRDKWKKEFPNLPIFDHNPEALRIDTAALTAGRTLNVPAKAEVRGIVGIMHYGFGRYTILLDADNRPTVTNVIRPLPLPPPADGQFSIAAANIESLMDDEDDPDTKDDVATTEAFEKRLGKISLAVRDYLHFPAIFAIEEAENLSVLKRLAERINREALQTGKPNPEYTAFLIEGNDPRGIDSGFLTKSSLVKVVDTRQIGKEELFTNPVTKSNDVLFDRPPLVLEAEIRSPNSEASIAVTIVVNHLKSLRGIDDPKYEQAVRLKRKLEAEYLAKWVNARQKQRPNEPLLLVGDFNAFQFNDGIVDVIGTIKGSPAPAGSVLLPTPDLVDPDLSNLVDYIKADQQYSFVFDASAQVLDHFLANDAMKRHLAGFGYLRTNADFPQVLRAEADRVERFSDHDVAVGYFTFAEAK